jgi:hypothetical protein
MGSTEHLHSPSAHGEEIHHETTDVNLTGITRLAIGSLLVIVAILLFVVGFEKVLAHFLVDTTRTLPTLADRQPGQDRLPKTPVVIITDEPGALRQLRTEEEQILNHYGWVDKNQGIVRIPISKAIELVAKNPALLAPQGAPAAAAPAPAAPAQAPPKGGQ